MVAAKHSIQKRNPTNRTFPVRFRWIFYVGIPAIALLLIANLFTIQVQHGSFFREQADNQYVVASYNAFERGSIFFSDRSLVPTTAAGLKKGYKLTIDPSHEKNLTELYDQINMFYPLGEKEKFLEAVKSESTYYELANELDIETAKKIKEEVGSRVQLYSEKWRVYPLGTVASHVLGIMGYQGDEYAGRYGLERFYENTLKRTSEDIYTNFFARIFHGVKNLNDDTVAREGDLITTIEPQVQMFLESTLKQVQDTWSSEQTGGIILNPKNGEIIAMAAFPNFNPNDFSQALISDFKNPLVENVYEMGSTMKPLVTAMAYDAGDINATTTYHDTGSVVVGNRTIYNFDKKGRGTVTVQDILNQSLNTGMVYIASRMDKDDFRNYFTKYGFGELTGIDLPNEVRGITSNLKSNRDVEFANMSFGQGIAISPIAMIRAVSALANKGMTVTPHLVNKITYRSGLSKTIEPPIGQQVVREETATEISKMLVNVFDTYNDGANKIPHYTVAGKTGTAQVPAPSGGYYTDRNLHSFIGYFPAYDSQYVLFLYTMHPKGIKYSSQTLLKPFRSTVEYLINYYNIPPDR